MSNSGKKAAAGGARPTTPEHWGGEPDPEELDKTPVEMPFSAAKPTPINEIVARLVAAHLEHETGQSLETFEEADDFEPEDEDHLDMSPYELSELQAEAEHDPQPPLDGPEDAVADPRREDEPPPDEGGDQPPDS